MVRSAKTALKFVLGKQWFTDEILVIALSHIENVKTTKNLQPLVTNLQSLTPNHLLLGRSNANIPPDVFSETELCAKAVANIAGHYRPVLVPLDKGDST